MTKSAVRGRLSAACRAAGNPRQRGANAIAALSGPLLQALSAYFTRTRLRQAAVLGALLLMAAPFSARAVEVGYAGFAYAGDFQSIPTRFKFTAQLVPPHAAGDHRGPSALEKQLTQDARSLKPAHFDLTVDSLGKLDSDQAVQVALVITRETVFTERIAELTRLYINLRGQALFFDFKSLTILRAYPISVIYKSATPTPPTEAEKLAAVSRLLSGTGPGSLSGVFLTRLTNAQLPGTAPRFIGVSDVTVASEAAGLIPPYLKGADVTETWLADELTQAIYDGAGIPVLPYIKGYAIGNTMSTNMADGSVFNLKLPKPDYAISIDLQALKKLKYGESKAGAGSSYIYGAYINLLIKEPLLNQCYFDAKLENGEYKLLPANSAIDDWSGYQAAILGVFSKLSPVLGGTDDKWIKQAFLGPGSCTTARDVMKQVKATREVIKRCK